MTHTFALLDLSPEAYAEIRAALLAAGYEHAFGKDDSREIIDMHGIAVRADATPPDMTLGPTTGALYEMLRVK